MEDRIKEPFQRQNSRGQERWKVRKGFKKKLEDYFRQFSILLTRVLRESTGISLAVQWLGLYTSTAGTKVLFLVRELDPHVYGTIRKSEGGGTGGWSRAK